MTSNDYLSLVVSECTRSKYSRWYVDIVIRAMTRSTTRASAKKMLGGYCEGHHILPKSFKMGGEKDAENIVYLSAREHLLIHILLTKMFVTGDKAASVNSALAYFNKKSKNHLGDSKLTSWKFEQMRAARATAARLNNIRPIRVDGVDYDSADHAAKCIGIKKTTIHYRANSSAFPSYEFTDGKTQKVVRKRYRNRVEIDGVIYDCVESARKSLGLKRCEIDARLSDINYPTYKGVDSVIAKKNRTLRESMKKSIIIDGVIYESIKEAAKVTGIDRSTIKGRAKASKFENYQLITV